MIIRLRMLGSFGEKLLGSVRFQPGVSAALSFARAGASAPIADDPEPTAVSAELPEDSLQCCEIV